MSLIQEMRKTPPGYYVSRFGLGEYTDWIDESRSWKESCYIGDWSFLWQRFYRGPDVLKLVSDFSVNSFAKFDLLQSKHVTHCDDKGKVIHEGILSRLAENEYMLFGRGGFWLDYQLRKGGYDVESVPSDGFNFQVSGPTAVAVMEKLCGSSVRDIKFMHSGKLRIAGHEVIALRQGMAGEPGYELQGAVEHSQDVYNAVFEAGQEFGMRRLGHRAAMINHLEACFPTIVTDYMPAIFAHDMKEYCDYFTQALPSFASTWNIAGSFESNDITDWYRSPVELGWGRNVKFDHDFLGSDALRDEVANPRRLIRTLAWDPADVVEVYASMFREGQPYDYMEMPRNNRGFMYADQVRSGGALVGVSTSRGYSYSFRKMLSLCVIDVDHAEPGSQVTVLYGNPGTPQIEIKATVAPAPFKTDNRRINIAA
jgi:vanillate/3-O-methylgallate O-demethylase